MIWQAQRGSDGPRLPRLNGGRQEQPECTLWPCKNSLPVFALEFDVLGGESR